MTGGNSAQPDLPAEDSRKEPPPEEKPPPAKQNIEEPELDDFGLPKKPVNVRPHATSADSEDEGDTFHDAEAAVESAASNYEQKLQVARQMNTNGESTASPERTVDNSTRETPSLNPTDDADAAQTVPAIAIPSSDVRALSQPAGDTATNIAKSPAKALASPTKGTLKRVHSSDAPAVSEWSHHRQIANATNEEAEEEEEETWQAMPAIDEFDVYDDYGRLVAKGNKQTEDETDAYVGLGGAGKGYTRVQLDEDAQSATSMDEDTNYLFKSGQKPEKVDEGYIEEDDQRDALTQLEATKDLLTEGQRIAYVAVVRLTVHKMFNALGDLEKTRGTRKELMKSVESMDMWSQTTMLRLYTHMDIDPAEQLMIEQLASHGVQPSDLVTPLMHNAKVDNPMASSQEKLQRPNVPPKRNSTNSRTSMRSDDLKDIGDGGEVPEVHGPEDMPQTKEIELDLRWTVLCDLFLVLISGSEYDARSRRLLERVASTMKITWTQICRFEKRVIDALEMQEDEIKENWDESEHMEQRRKLGLKRKYMVMGLATVGGGLVIGLSAGLLAPVIGAGLAAGFTTIGVTGTAGFLGGVGGAALITSAATAAGGTIAVRASDRRTGHVKTFEYRPLHNNKRLNLILTVSGWMTGKVDDVRLPYSTIDPIMGDIYSLLWEPEMLQSMGDTINILATEALTQTVQQVLGSTILVALMASIQLPVVLTKLAYLIDNPWSVSLDRANAAGLILADSLIDRHLGQRPITLLGFSLGSRLIFSCLKELSRRGAYGLVQNVYLFGSPVVAKRDDYLRARSVVSGRFLNGYASNDWILGYLFRATAGGIMRVAGLAPVEDVPGVENVDVGSMVTGHMSYRAAMPRLMREVGWEVESDEFTEIEDADPENHAQRQRELIQEIDEARKKAEEKPEKRRFGLFKRGKLADKKGWERYDVNQNGHKRAGSTTPNGSQTGDDNILFDIDAIRKELESEMIEVRELDSTLPPMQITSIQNGEKHVEYLRLPPDLKPEEVARMNLPPRPDEVNVDFGHQQPALRLPARVSSLRPSSSARSSPQSSPRPSPIRSPQQSFDSGRRSSYGYSEPRELTSTMPVLSLTSSLPRTESDSAPSIARPELKTHASEPPSTNWNQQSNLSSNGLTPSMAALNIGHNAWADDDANLGHDSDGVSMTFE
ncbi:hypothetical protein LTR10_020701 [Elasticomyces elasticus]|uniref:DUF726 domain protein n=1 Tax=Exophiala sideris TaxID=1016849 RepID=A0ABR0JIV2_9EURO|nr:hypothetical protein LTR10_020701 [Elasticomyces elasticus]KAK5033552.1 hypothetical protein LTS07_003857 [Exophiala sideris]KAK5041953.1 hypothetical protein LTR13_001758 [Exophiala sideris]KAK5064096.1 hypothetical protein LTR69_003865 [Exophiala sideris]KAK5185221.1 hypothetical protein LTR44_002209 [Eurotiomycetes sp. CCFEE 6388]